MQATIDELTAEVASLKTNPGAANMSADSMVLQMKIDTLETEKQALMLENKQLKTNATVALVDTAVREVLSWLSKFM